MAKRAIIIVLDSVGAGAMPDAAEYGDEGANTLGNLSRAFPNGIHLPNLGKLGLGNILEIRGVPPDPAASGSWGKCAELSKAKDTTLGHWEIAGLVSTIPFPTYPNGFPREVLDAFEREIGIETLGNIPASGTEIIQLLGDIHVRSKKPIVYTSADSVFQIACHESVYPPEQLYEMCRIARRILDGPHRVGRVIARPFNGQSGDYRRTRNRRDFAVPPPEPTLLDRLKDAAYDVIGIGKIGDIFAHRGLTREIPTKSNEEGILATLVQINEAPDGLIFTNLVDTDMIYGHRRDAGGYRDSLQQFDSYVPKIIQALGKEDLLLITADHGCDPTFKGTDHTREYVPLLACTRSKTRGVNLGTRASFCDIAATVAEHLQAEFTPAGTSFHGSLVPPLQPGRAAR